MRRLVVRLMKVSHTVPGFMVIPPEEVQGFHASELAQQKTKGEGGFAAVIQVRLKRGTVWVDAAAKLLKISDGENRAERLLVSDRGEQNEPHLHPLQQAYTEAMNVWSLKHPNIVELFGVTYPPTGELALLCPWQTNGDASSCLRLWAVPGAHRPDSIVEYSNKWVSLVYT